MPTVHSWHVSKLTISIAIFIVLGCGDQVHISDEESGVNLTYDCGSFSSKVETYEDTMALSLERMELHEFVKEKGHQNKMNESSLERDLVKYKCEYKEEIRSFYGKIENSPDAPECVKYMAPGKVRLLTVRSIRNDNLRAHCDEGKVGVWLTEHGYELADSDRRIYVKTN
jgi:hypothetical protein